MAERILFWVYVILGWIAFANVVVLGRKFIQSLIENWHPGNKRFFRVGTLIAATFCVVCIWGAITFVPRCPNCYNASLLSPYCEQCGEFISSEFTCENCHSIVKESAKFCGKCGTKIP